MPLRFVDPDTTRLDLPGGDWLEVKTRLPYGAAEKLRTGAFRSMRSEDGQQVFDLDLSKYNLDRMAAYIVDWSARTENGKPVPVSRDAFAALDDRAARELTAALDEHIRRQEEAAKEEDSDPTPRAIPPSSYSHVGSTGPVPTSSTRPMDSFSAP